VKRLAVLALLAACSSNSENTGSTSSGASVPCDVDAILKDKCQRCHGEKPQFGAPMPLVTWEDVQAPGKSDPSKKVLDLMLLRINDAQNPMPQGDTLAPHEKTALETWLKAGAPKGGATCSNQGPTAARDIGPQHLPCAESEQVRFTAHGEGDSKYQVPVDADNLNMCFTWRAPFDDGTQMTAFAPIIDDGRVVHHWILFQTAVPQTEGGFKKCQMPADSTFLAGWAPGAGNSVMPPDIGQVLPGKDRWLILQLHYWNVAGHKDALDKSGVAMCTTKTPRPKAGTISRLGTANIALPARSKHTVSGKCTPSITQPVTIYGASPHMHQLGRTFKLEILRGGKEENKELVLEVARFDFNKQGSYPVSAVVQPGDTLRTTCGYDNSTDQKVYFGEKTENEMCFGFLATYPAPGLINAGGAATHGCIDPE
jgi:hypothetical protein